MRKFLLSASLIASLLTAPALAQTSSDVQFDPGTSGATLNATIIGDEYIDFVLGAQSGQMMKVDLTVDSSNGNGVVYFNLLPPESDGVAIYNGSIDGNSAQVELPENGDYTIRVYQMGNDRDTGRTSGFQIDVSIE